jgi:hypothetical protein
VAVARGNEKGRVERAIRYIRDNFFPGRERLTLDELNAEADAWCQGTSADRVCPEDRDLTVRDAFIKEQPVLLALPDNPFNTQEKLTAIARKTPYIRFDQNDYSIPHQYVQKSLQVVADLKRVRVLDAGVIIAEHERRFSKGEQIEQEAHINALWLAKTHAKQHRGQDRLSHASDYAQTFLMLSCKRGHILKTTVRTLNQLLDDYGREALDSALKEALHQQSVYTGAVQQILERQRDERQRPPPIALALPEKVKHLSVKLAKLTDYDDLNPQKGNDNGNENDNDPS